MSDKEERYMYLIEHKSYWSERTDNKWSILHGCHIIQELEGNFVNYHHNGKPTIISSIENKIVLTKKELWNFVNHDEIDESVKKDFLGIDYNYRDKDINNKRLENYVDYICYAFNKLIEENFFSRKILLKNHRNGHILLNNNLK